MNHTRAVAAPGKVAHGSRAQPVKFRGQLLSGVEGDVFRHVLGAKNETVPLIAAPLAERVAQHAGGEDGHDGNQERNGERARWRELLLTAARWLAEIPQDTGPRQVQDVRPHDDRAIRESHRCSVRGRRRAS